MSIVFFSVSTVLLLVITLNEVSMAPQVDNANLKSIAVQFLLKSKFLVLLLEIQ